MKNRFLRFGKMLSVALCVLLMGGWMYSCSDNYDLPKKKPSWLGESIYNYMVEQGNFTNTIKLIDDLDYAEVLAKTGSKTLFVADDEAFARFYAKNNWGVKKYEDLTQSQKKLLLNAAMLDNAYLLEMLPNSSSSSQQPDGGYTVKNVCLKSPTALAAVDSIALVKWNASEQNGIIPVSYNPEDKDYWARFKNSSDTLYIATDGSLPWMIHWINGQMGVNNINDDDFAKIVGRTRESNDVYINSSKVVQQDVTCQNGYLNVMDEVMIQPASMAEVLRTNGLTNLYSHLIDRFSAPYYSEVLTQAYRQINPAADSVFEKRYISTWSHGANSPTAAGSSNYNAPNDNTKDLPYLLFDPAWNGYYPISYDKNGGMTAGKARDMGVMFAPTDSAMLDYFKTGGGKFLMERYALELPVTKENLMVNVDQVPKSVIKEMINNLMKESFLTSVPSKYLTILNDAKDAMFADYETLEDYKNLIDTSYVASNGVIYVMNKVLTPATYACVAAPTLINDTLHIFNWGITADDKFQHVPASAPIGAYFSVYLRAMNSTLSLFVPSDRALQKYYDPVSRMYSTPYVLKFEYDKENDNVLASAYKYDPFTLEVDANRMSKAIKSEVINNRLLNLLNTHIIVHDNEQEPTGISVGREYYLSRDGSPIRMTGFTGNKPEQIKDFKVQGGFQLEHDKYCNVTRMYDQSRESNGYGNGRTYLLDDAIQGTFNSVYNILYDNADENSPFKLFYELCSVDHEILGNAGFADNQTTLPEKEQIYSRYDIFTSANPCLDFNVRFFNCYNYTVFVPTNEAIQDAIDNRGLPTWESIAKYIDEQVEILDAKTNPDSITYDPDFDADAFIATYKAKAQAMCLTLMNFVKYHFMDSSVFADLVSQPQMAHETACINYESNRYYSIQVGSEGNHTLTIIDANDEHAPRHLVSDKYNLLARDIVFDNVGRNANTIEAASYTVIHQVDGVLDFKKYANNRYDSEWATLSAAKKCVAQYTITK